MGEGGVGQDSGHRTYSETVARGLYDRSQGGLSGKHDNVRTYWEDQLSRQAARPVVRDLVAAARTRRRGVRILDLGCGAGQGLELLTRMYETEAVRDDPRYVLPFDEVALYLGLDLSAAMLERGRANYAGLQSVRFEAADLREGLGCAAAEPPFDLYYSAYGAMSHLSGPDLARLLAEIARHARPGAAIVLDLVGRHSLEWPGHWRAPNEQDKTRSYSMSYLYDSTTRGRGHVEEFPLRFWTGKEIADLVRVASTQSGTPLRVVELMDRSLFVGRHVDTREYGCTLPPLRGLVNRLLEHHVRTPIEALRAGFEPVPGAADQNEFFAMASACWNQIVDFCLARLDGRRLDLVSIPGWRDSPAALQLALMTIDRIVDSVAWIDVGDVRANVIEPQLAYCLRRLEYALQRGRGCGHGLVAVLRVDPRS